MNDNSNINWYSCNDKKLGETIGAFIKHHRIKQQYTQQDLAKNAGISRSTLSLLERGEPVTLMTLLQVLRVLNLLHVMNEFKIEKTLSPIALAKAEQAERQRVRTKNKPDSQTNSEW